jgi:membrane protease YdiL (CAAX protease family)
MRARRVVIPPDPDESRIPSVLGVAWAAFVVVGLLLMGVIGDVAYGVAVAAIALSVCLIGLISRRVRVAFPLMRGRVDGRDLAAVAAVYLVVVALFRLAFTGFTTENTLGMFLSFASALTLGVAGPVIYTVWLRRRPLASLGIGLRGWRTVVAAALLFAGVQFAITLWGYDLPRSVDWVPLLSMSLTVGLFESIFFRGFVQGRFEASFGTAPAVAGAAALYALYHVGYGMGADEIAFLFGLGIVYAVAYRISGNVLVLWPLLTPMGSFFAQLESGELTGQLPWAAISGFADVIGLMAGVIWFAHRRERRSAHQLELGPFQVAIPDRSSTSSGPSSREAAVPTTVHSDGGGGDGERDSAG